jgi:cytochrome oxidase assembly protein ShyY1
MRFRFRTIPFVATLLLVGLGIALGNWQTRRAAEKTALQARLQQRSAQAPLVLDGKDVDPAAVEYRRVMVSGTFLPNWTVYLDNRPLDGRSGFVVVTPLRIAGSDRVVLVERGWAPRDPAVHDRVPTVPPPAGLRTVEGSAVSHPARVMDLGTPPPPAPGAIVQNLDVDGFARASGLSVLPVLVEQAGPAGEGDAALVRQWAAPATDVDRHKGYAFQWYALAGMAGLFYLITGFRRARKQA